MTVSTNLPYSSDDSEVLKELTRLRSFEGSPAVFWPSLCSCLGKLIQAEHGLLILRNRKQPENLRKLNEWRRDKHATPAVAIFLQQLPSLVVQTSQNLTGILELNIPNSKAVSFALCAVLQFEGGEEECFAAYLLSNTLQATAQDALVRLQLAADIPKAFQINQSIIQARKDTEKFAVVMDVLATVNNEKRFLAAALSFCNAVSGRFQCERASIGWLVQDFIKLKAISRTERFDKNMLAVKALEAVMDEALDQDEEIIYPAPEGTTSINREHQQFAQQEKNGNMVSLPLRLDNKAIGVLTCERISAPFTEIEIRQLRLACDQVIRRLSELQNSDRWIGARWASMIREKAAKILGPEHTWAKLLACLGAIILLALILPIYPYRVEGNFILRSEEVSYLTVPFDGYIKSVSVRPGDALGTNDVLMQLNTEQLELEESAAIADQTRYLREAEKARANKSLADMRIAQALADQAKARLDLVRFHLAQANIKSPWPGVLIEGDLRQRIGAPVKQGDALFKVARLDSLYVEAEINERDIHEILNKKMAEISFVSQPKLRFPCEIIRIEPASVAKQQVNVFLVRCKLSSRTENWWRPGMSGICKITVERRTLLWIISHRTIDFLRLFLWW